MRLGKKETQSDSFQVRSGSGWIIEEDLFSPETTWRVVCSNAENILCLHFPDKWPLMVNSDCLLSQAMQEGRTVTPHKNPSKEVNKVADFNNADHDLSPPNNQCYPIPSYSTGTKLKPCLLWPNCTLNSWVPQKLLVLSFIVTILSTFHCLSMSHLDLTAYQTKQDAGFTPEPLLSCFEAIRCDGNSWARAILIMINYITQGRHINKSQNA